MKNLSNYGVASIDTEEMKETNGGFLPLLIQGYIVYKVGKFVYESIEGAYEAGYDQGKANCN